MNFWGGGLEIFLSSPEPQLQAHRQSALIHSGFRAPLERGGASGTAGAGELPRHAQAAGGAGDAAGGAAPHLAAETRHGRTAAAPGAPPATRAGEEPTGPRRLRGGR